MELKEQLKIKCIRNQIPTITFPNWLSILTGVPPSQHQQFDNRVDRKKVYSTLLDFFEKSILVSDWHAFRHVAENSGHRFLFHSKLIDEHLLQSLVDQEYDLIVVNYQRLDTIGHTFGWGSVPYLKTMTRILNRVMHLVSFFPNAMFLLTSDHGGLENDHEEYHSDHVRRVPLMMSRNTPYTIERIRETIDVPRILKTVSPRKTD